MSHDFIPEQQIFTALKMKNAARAQNAVVIIGKMMLI